MTINEAYKTLRNHLRKAEVIDSLEVVWAYARNILYGKAFPPGVTPFPGFIDSEHLQKLRWVAPWELEVLCREVILHASLGVAGERTLRGPNYFVGAINKLKNLEGAISEEYLNTENILRELNRIAHRQFSWQLERPNSIAVARYFKVFGEQAVSQHVEHYTGLTTAKIFGIGIGLWSRFSDHFAAPSIDSKIPEISQRDIDLFLNLFCTEIVDLQRQLRDEVQLNDRFNYAFHSLKRFPLLKHSDQTGRRFFSPLPDLVFRQITAGLYYQVPWKGRAGNLLGEAFQGYVGELLEASGLGSRFAILPEEPYGKEERNTVDWVVADDEEALFVECKTKRFTFAAKEELLDNQHTEADLDRIANAVVQIYKTIRDYREGKYPVPFPLAVDTV